MLEHILHQQSNSFFKSSHYIQVCMLNNLSHYQKSDIENCNKFDLINRNLWTAMKNELSLSGVTSQVIEPRLSMGVNVLCFELAVILEFSAF